MTLNAKHVTNKMASIICTKYNKNYDVVHITEAGLGKKLPNTLKVYKAIKHDHDAQNSGSIMYIKDYYHDKIFRIIDPEDKRIGSEILHILL